MGGTGPAGRGGAGGVTGRSPRRLRSQERVQPGVVSARPSGASGGPRASDSVSSRLGAPPFPSGDRGVPWVGGGTQRDGGGVYPLAGWAGAQWLQRSCDIHPNYSVSSEARVGCPWELRGERPRPPNPGPVPP